MKIKKEEQGIGPPAAAASLSSCGLFFTSYYIGSYNSSNWTTLPFLPRGAGGGQG